jgi:transposase
VLKTARAILAHLKRIPAYFTHRVTNALMEWNNSRQGAMTKRPYGFKTLRYLGMKIFKILGKFKFDEPRLA